MKNGVILRKLQVLDGALGNLKSLGEVTAPGLEADWRTRRAVERELQILVEVVIDACQRILALAKQTPAASGAEAVDRCVALGALSKSDAYRRMVQFRNFVVHRDENVDVSILADIVNRRLSDFELFRDEVLRYARS